MAVVDRTPVVLGLSPAEIGDVLDCEVAGFVPYVADALRSSQLEGTPLVAFQPESRFTTSLAELATHLGASSQLRVGLSV